MKRDRLTEYAIELQSLAQAGLHYGKDIYDRERYERIREIAAEIISMKTELPLGHGNGAVLLRQRISDAEGRYTLRDIQRRENSARTRGERHMVAPRRLVRGHDVSGGKCRQGNEGGSGARRRGEVGHRRAESAIFTIFRLTHTAWSRYSTSATSSAENLPKTRRRSGSAL